MSIVCTCHKTCEKIWKNYVQWMISVRIKKIFSFIQLLIFMKSSRQGQSLTLLSCFSNSCFFQTWLHVRCIFFQTGFSGTQCHIIDAQQLCQLSDWTLWEWCLFYLRHRVKPQTYKNFSKHWFETRVLPCNYVLLLTPVVRRVRSAPGKDNKTN